jgi:protein TonB
MSNRLTVALALSGALHAGLFVATSGPHQWLLAGLHHPRSTETLTVSIRAAVNAADETRGPAKVSRQGSHRARKVASAPSPTPPAANRILVRRAPDKTPRRPPAKSGRLRVTANKDEPGQSTAKAPPESRRMTEATGGDRSSDHRISDQVATGATSRHDTLGERKTDGDGRKAAERTYLAEFLAALSRYKHYPQSARLRRQEGRVVVALLLAKDGTIKDVQIKEPSRFPLLNRAALRSVRELDRFKPFPAGMDRSAWQLSVPFQYAIRDQ